MKTGFVIYLVVVIVLIVAFLSWFYVTDDFPDDKNKNENEDENENENQKKGITKKNDKFQPEIVGDRSRGDFIGEFDELQLKKYVYQQNDNNLTVLQKCEQEFCDGHCGIVEVNGNLKNVKCCNKTFYVQQEPYCIDLELDDKCQYSWQCKSGNCVNDNGKRKCAKNVSNTQCYENNDCQSGFKCVYDITNRTAQCENQPTSKQFNMDAFKKMLENPTFNSKVFESQINIKKQNYDANCVFDSQCNSGETCVKNGSELYGFCIKNLNQKTEGQTCSSHSQCAWNKCKQEKCCGLLSDAVQSNVTSLPGCDKFVDGTECGKHDECKSGYCHSQTQDEKIYLGDQPKTCQPIGLERILIDFDTNKQGWYSLESQKCQYDSECQTNKKGEKTENGKCQILIQGVVNKDGYASTPTDLKFGFCKNKDVLQTAASRIKNNNELIPTPFAAEYSSNAQNKPPMVLGIHQFKKMLEKKGNPCQILQNQSINGGAIMVNQNQCKNYEMCVGPVTDNQNTFNSTCHNKIFARQKFITEKDKYGTEYANATKYQPSDELKMTFVQGIASEFRQNAQFIGV